MDSERHLQEKIARDLAILEKKKVFYDDYNSQLKEIFEKAERAEGIAPLQLRIAFQYRISYTPLSPTPCPSVLQLPVRIRPAAFVPLKL